MKRRSDLLKSLPKEPSAPTSGAATSSDNDNNVVSVALKMLDGSRHIRRFKSTDTLSLLLTWADGCGCDLYTNEFYMPIPNKKIFKHFSY